MSQMPPPLPEEPNPYAYRPGSGQGSGGASGGMSGGMSAGAERPLVSVEEVHNGRVLAVLTYVFSLIGLPFFWILPMVLRDNRFALYHSKQGLMLCLFMYVGGAILGILMVVLMFATCGVGALVAWPIIIVYYLAYFVLSIVGLVYSLDNACKPLPLIGGLAERWFRGISMKTGV